MPDLSTLMAFYSPETGLNYNLLIAWALILAFGRKLFLKLGDRISDKILILLNKIPLLENTDVDEIFFGAVVENLRTRVLAAMQDAQEIKEKYFSKIAEALQAGDREKVDLLSKQQRQELEALTKRIVDDFFSDSENVLWKTLVGKYGDQAAAAKWVYKKIKALVEEMKDPSHPSTSVLIARHTADALGDLGNALSNRTGSDD